VTTMDEARAAYFWSQIDADDDPADEVLPDELIYADWNES